MWNSPPEHTPPSDGAQLHGAAPSFLLVGTARSVPGRTVEDGMDIIWDALVRAARGEKVLDSPGQDLDWLHRRFLATQLNVGTRTWKRFKRRYAEQIELDDMQQWVRLRPQP